MTGDGHEKVRRWLLERGATDEEIEQATADGTLHLMVADRIVLPDPLRFTAAEIAELTGMAPEQVIRMRRALGFPIAGPDEVAYSDADLQALTTVQGIHALGLAGDAELLQLTRVIGSSMARIAEAHVEVSPRLRGHRPSEETAELYILAADAIFTDLARLLEFAWRRHMQSAVRQLGRRVHRTSEAGAVDMAVGFADLVGFTALSQQLSEGALSRLVSHFEELAYDTVAQLGGRVVKTIGDEVMFVCNDAADAAVVALELNGVYARDDMLSEVRVGIAAGPVLLQDGDCYGPPVNLAHRIVKIAAPGSILVDPEVHARLEADGRFGWKSLRPRYLKDLGRVALWVLFARGEEAASRPRRLGLVADTLREQVERAHALGRGVISPPGDAV